MNAAFAEFEHKWLQAQPEQRIVDVFLVPEQRARAHAFGTLVHELEQAAFHVREQSVAVAKLSWWAQELGSAAHGTARHPVAQALFADAATRAADPTLWPALAEGAMSQLEQPGAGTLAALFDALDSFYAVVAHVESVLFCDGRANIEANAALWKIAHLLRSLPNLHLDDARLPLPLGLLARYGVTRAELATETPARNMLIKDFLDELTLEMNGALGVASARPLAQRVRVQLDRKLIAGALRAKDPFTYLVRHRARNWQALWIAWREARAQARERC